MRKVSCTEFRNHVSDLLNEVERGETLLVLRHGRPIAEVSPAAARQPSWKQPALRLSTKGAALSAAIFEERKEKKGG